MCSLSFPAQESEVEEPTNCEMTSSDQKLTRLEGRVKLLRQKLRKVRKEKRVLLKGKARQEVGFSKLFGADQLKALHRGGMRGVKWSPTTIKKAIQLRFACGPTGYELLLKQHQPLPSIRTLQRRMKTLSFKPGVLSQVFGFMKLKVKEMREEERICCLTIDEMSITPTVEYDASSGKLLGNVTLPNHTGNATHAMVIMLGGVTSRWKQTVAYHFTGNSTDGAEMKPIVLDVIKQATDTGLHVLAVTSDMGTVNRAMWRSFGIICGKHCKTVNKIKHPSDDNKWLYFLADVPHLIKNIKAALIRGHTFAMSPAIVQTYKLQSCSASLSPVKDLAKFQENKELKLAPHLTSAVLAPSHFEKMKVSNALSLISHSVSAGIRYMVECEGRSASNLTTAWFLEMMNHWFDLVSSRHPVMALSKLHQDKYAEAIKFLEGINTIFRSMKVGDKGEWKPIQTGVILSTTSILGIQEELLDKGHKFLLTSRLTQDCLENLFSSVRLKNPIPTPLAFKCALKLISIAQFLKTSHKGSYQQDDGDFLANFLDQPVTTPAVPAIAKINLSKSKSVPDLCGAEMNSLHYLAGYCAHSVLKNNRHCASCKKGIILEQASSTDVGKLTKLKEYKEGCLVHVTQKVFDLLLKVELIIRGYEDDTLMNSRNAKKLLLGQADKETNTIQIEDCHGLKQRLINKYVNVRLHIFGKRMRCERRKEMEKSKSGSELGSKSMAMRKLVKKIK